MAIKENAATLGPDERVIGNGRRYDDFKPNLTRQGLSRVEHPGTGGSRHHTKTESGNDLLTASFSIN